MRLILIIISLLIYPLRILIAALIFTSVHPQVAVWAILGGVVPSCVWLFFWIQEDRLHPEPKKIIWRSFGAGIIAVLIAVGLEHLIQPDPTQATLLIFFIFALVEEIFKYWAAYFSCINTPYNDEPIDPAIYLISAALGFAALENIFFLNTPILQNNLFNSVVTGNLRFLGANLLHVISSATIGIFIAFAFYKPPWQRRLYLIIGLVLAVVLHGLFNFFIIKAGGDLFLIFGAVWLCVILLILVFEKVKTIKRTS
ncbi:MAG TPA: PrsW family glutamic-type intramembrane protease [Candidatus Paceibacterota bacterium]|nr:PrsW family glutamic-type intramembrane protease [Candidatus Paceibacterota bacterium]